MLEELFAVKGINFTKTGFWDKFDETSFKKAVEKQVRKEAEKVTIRVKIGERHRQEEQRL